MSIMEKSVFKYIVEPKLVDFTDRISVSSMFDLILGAAGEDAHRRGFGVEFLAQNNCGWVLSRICFELDRLPSSLSRLHSTLGLAIITASRQPVTSRFSMLRVRSLVVLCRSGVCSTTLLVCQWI